MDFMCYNKKVVPRECSQYLIAHFHTIGANNGPIAVQMGY